MNLLNLKQAIRNLQRNRIYTLINIMGIGVSTAFILLVAAYVHHALTMDRYSAEVKQLYRIEMNDFWSEKKSPSKKGLFDRLTEGADEKLIVSTPVILAADLKKNFPEIKDVCRITNFYQPVIRLSDRSFREEEQRVGLVDPDFFSVFGLSIVNGNNDHAFLNNNSAVITESAAKKYFGKDNPVGKIIRIDDDANQYIISAVAKDFPANSSIQFNLMIPVEGSSSYASQLKQGLNTLSHITVFNLQPNVNINDFRKKLRVFGQSYYKSLTESVAKNEDQPKAEINLSFRPFSEGHFNISGSWFYYTDVKGMYQLLLLAAIALIIASINYVLLSLSRVAARSHEAGVRKTVGAGWKNIISLFLTETQVLVFLSVIFGFVLALLALPYFSVLTAVSLTSAEIINWQIVATGVLLSVLLTVVAGIYPAIKMAGISPLTILNKFGTYKVNPSLSKVFITIQYTACIVLVIFAIVVARQVNFAYNKDLGFDKEQTMIITNPYWGDREKTMELRERLHHFASSQPSIAGVTGTTFRFGGTSTNGHYVNGKHEMIGEIKVDYDYFSLNKIPILKGREFSPDFASDTTRLNIDKAYQDTAGSKTMANLVVNETLYGLLGKPPLNEPIKSLAGVIVGVCKDYFYEGLQQKIGPLYHRCQPKNLGYFWFRIEPNQNVGAVIREVKTAYDAATGREPFTYTFMDEDVKTVYESHARWLKVISVASWMAIIIACLGLFGLSAIAAVNRTKEIGIRKVLGASVADLFMSLNRQTFLLVVLSICIAVPIALYISNSWLENFAYRIRLNLSIFLIAAMIGLICAFIAVSYHTLRVVRTNPVKSLRSE